MILDLLLYALANGLAVAALWFGLWPGNLLGRAGDFVAAAFGDYWGKPLALCPGCMGGSIYGLLGFLLIPWCTGGRLPLHTLPLYLLLSSAFASITANLIERETPKDPAGADTPPVQAAPPEPMVYNPPWD